MAEKSWQGKNLIARVEKEIWAAWETHVANVKGQQYIHVNGYRYFAGETQARMEKRADAQEFAA